MSWIEISFETHQSQAQLYCDKLESLGAVSVSFYDAGITPILEPLPGTTPLWEKVKIVGLFTQTDFSQSIIQALQKLIPHTPIKQTTLQEQDWSRTWLEHFKPLQFGQKLWIVPSGTTIAQDGAVMVNLDPGLAFGTGTHPTTALCLRWLDAHPPINQTVIDYGCGSGILGIAALKLGAKHVYAIDYDPQALCATQDNTERNAISQDAITVISPTQLPANLKADLLLANILAQPLIQLAPVFTSLCQPNSHLVMSGLLTHQVDAVKTAYADTFTVHEIQTEEEWALLWCIKN